jgi:hypothetical protein
LTLFIIQVDGTLFGFENDAHDYKLIANEKGFEYMAFQSGSGQPTILTIQILAMAIFAVSQLMVLHEQHSKVI